MTILYSLSFYDICKIQNHFIILLSCQKYFRRRHITYYVSRLCVCVASKVNTLIFSSPHFTSTGQFVISINPWRCSLCSSKIWFYLKVKTLTRVIACYLSSTAKFSRTNTRLYFYSRCSDVIKHTRVRIPSVRVMCNLGRRTGIEEISNFKVHSCHFSRQPVETWPNYKGIVINKRSYIYTYTRYMYSPCIMVVVYK